MAYLHKKSARQNRKTITVGTVDLKKPLTLRRLRNLLYEDNLQFTKGIGMVTIAAFYAPYKFTKAIRHNVNIMPQHLRVLCAVSALQVANPRVKRYWVTEIVGGDSEHVPIWLKELVDMGYVAVITKNPGGKVSRGQSILLTMEGHNLLMQYAHFCIDYMMEELSKPRLTSRERKELKLKEQKLK